MGIGAAALSRKAKIRNGPSPLDQALTDKRGPRGLDRLRKAVEATLIDYRWGTPVGRLYLKGEASKYDFHAATQFAALRSMVDRIHGLPPRHVPAVDLNMVKGLSLIADREPDRDRLLCQKYYEAEEAIGKGSEELAAVQYVVIYDNAPAGYEHKKALLRGLDRLIKHWKLKG